MPVLLNKELVANEIMELARIKISFALRVPIKIVEAKWERRGDRAMPAFNVDMDQVVGMDEGEVKLAIGAVWRWLGESFSQRMAGLGQQRNG